MKKQKVISLIVSMFMLVSLFPASVFAAAAGTTFTSGDFTYKVNDDTSTVTLTAIAAAKLTGEVTVPDVVSDGTEDYTVTKLGDAFKNQGTKTDEMTSLILPDTITKFTGTATFYGCKFTDVHLPAALTGDSTGDGYLTRTFYFCSKLTAVEIPAGITKLYGTFNSLSAVRTVTLKSTAEADFFAGSGSSDARAWADNTTGITIYYPDNGTAPKRTSASGSFTATVLTYENEDTEPDAPLVPEEPEVSPYTYKVVSEENKTIMITGGKDGMVLSGKVVIPSEIDGYTVISLGNASFGYGLFRNVTSVTVPDTIKKIEESNCFYYCKNIEEIILPAEMEYIGTGAFTGCSALKSIVIPNGVKKLSKTFRSCTSLETVTIPSSVVEMDNQVFGKTDTSTEVLPGVTVKCAIGSYAEQYAKANGIKVKYSEGELYTYTENSDGTITIDSMAADVEIAGTVEIPEIYDGKTVTAIGNGAFRDREDIKSIVLPSTINAIGEEAFANCVNINVFDIPEGVETLNNTFIGCTGLNVITIPESVTSISDETFYTDYKSNGGVPVSNLMIYCVAGSAAEAYAAANSIDYEAERILPPAWDGTVDISWYDENVDEYYISDAAQLAGLRELVNSGRELFYGKTVNLTADINMEGTVWKVGIGYDTGNTAEERIFNGVFNGNEYIISNFTYDSSADSDTVSDVVIPDVESHKYHGLFGILGLYGKVENLGIENAQITAGSKANKVVIFVGTIAGTNKGEINHCYINNSKLAGGYWGSWCEHSYGGFVGTNSGTLKDCFIKNINLTDIVAQPNATRKSAVTATNSGIIKDCYASKIVYDNVNGYYTWNEDGSGKDKCPVMFCYDPIASISSGTVENVYSDDAYCRKEWTVGVRVYDDFDFLTDRMNSALEKLTFRTIEHSEMSVDVQKADGNLAGIRPEVALTFTQASNGESINDATVILKQGEDAVNSVNISYRDDANYPFAYTLNFEDDLLWNTEYEISVVGARDFWNREIAPVSEAFKTTNEIVYDEFALYENYGASNERKITSLANVSGPVTAVIKGLRNNGDKSYNAVFSVSAVSDGQILKGGAKLVNIASYERKTSPVIAGNINIGAFTANDIEMQAVLYKAFGNVVPLIKSVQAVK